MPDIDRGTAVRRGFLCALLATLFLPAVSYAAQRYVAPGGTDAANDCLTSGTPCLTITYAIGVSAASDTINVAAGTYIENPVANKPLTILGANAGVAGASPRGAESIVQTSGNQNAVFSISSASVRIDGFTLDGDDPLVTGVSLSSGEDANVQYGIRVTAALNNLAIANNIIKHAFIGVRGDGAAQNNSIDHNWFDSIGNFDFGYAVSLRTNFYADVTNNRMTRVWTGVHVDGHNGAGGPATWSIANNNIDSFAGGILYWFQSNGATGANISANTVKAESGVVANNFGILLVTIQDAVSPSISGNTITGQDYGVGLFNVPTTSTITIAGTNAISGSRLAGVLLTNNLDFDPIGTTNFLAGGPGAASSVNVGAVSITGSLALADGIKVDATGGTATSIVVNGATISGSAAVNGVEVSGATGSASLTATSISGFATGVAIDAGTLTIGAGDSISGGSVGLSMNGASAVNTGDTIGNLSFTGQTLDYIAFSSNANDNKIIDATSASFDGVTGATASLAQNFAIEDKIVHAIDDASLGFVRVKAANAFLTATGTPLLQRAVDAVVAGDMVNVAAGTFPGETALNKSLTLLGPNAGIDPNTGVRVAEANLIPSVTSTSNQGSTSGVILRAGGGSPAAVTIDGFTIDGHNPSLTGGRTLNGVEIHTGAGIANSTGSFDNNPQGYDAAMMVRNNIIRNLERYGVLADGIPSGSPMAGTDVSHNQIDNLPSGNNFGGDRGRAVAFADNHYGSATFNVISRVNVGIEDDNFYQASPAGPLLFTNNTIRTYHRGIFHNLQYETASDATISNNDISAETSGDFPASSTNFGIELASIESAVGVTVSGNDTSGMVYGMILWNIPTTGPINISGGTLANNGTGMYITDNDPQFGSGVPGTATVRDVTITGSSVAAFGLESNALQTTTVTTTYSRIVGNAAGVTTTGSGPFAATFETNWWGCNAGPAILPSTNAGCNSVAAGVDADPWLVLRIAAAPGTIPYTGTSAITQDLTHDSNGADTSGGGFLPDGIPVSFGSTGGTIAPPTSATTNSQSTAIFTATSVGPGSASTTVDNQTVSTPITITQVATSTNLGAVPNPSTYGGSVTFTATMSAAAAGATGSVQFLEGLAVLGTAPLIGTTASFSTPAFGGGSHAIHAVYSGDTNFTGSTSNVVTQVVNRATPVVTPSAVPTSSSFGQSVTFTANVTAGATGSIQFLDGATSLGTVPLAAGSASFTTSALSAASHTINMQYSGDANFSSASAPLTFVVGLQPTTTSVISSGSPSTIGQSVTFTATVTAGATGNVAFRDGLTVLGTVPLTGTTAAFTTSTLAGGSHSISAIYNGDASYATSTSPSITQLVNLLPSTVTPSAVPTSSTYGQSVTFTATVTAGATGSVEFLDGATSLGTVPLAAGSASLTTSALSGASHTINMQYGGDATFGTASASITFVVSAAPTTTGVISSGSPSTVGQSVTFTATVTAGATGTVSFFDGATLLGTVPLTGTTAAFTTSTLELGTHSISAIYNGDTNYTTSTSPSIGQIVNASAAVPALGPLGLLLLALAAAMTGALTLKK